VLQRKRRVLEALGSESLRLVTFVALVLSFFYLVWGVNYARRPLPQRLGWTPIDAPADSAQSLEQLEILNLTHQLVDATNASYREFAGSDDLGRPSTRPAAGPSLDAVLDAGFARVQKRLGLEPQFAAARGPAKPILASRILSHFRIAGFYFPWTGEADYNRLAPAASAPESVAHEKAHQRGIAPEDEAGFIGYLACAMSDDAFTRYAGYLYAQRELLNELRTVPEVRALIGLRVRGVRRDVDAMRAYWQQYQGRAATVSFRVNDSYLKSQGVKQGIWSYAASRNLIVLFARKNGGSAVVGK
jgi:uncharacterized protein DUF3810